MSETQSRLVIMSVAVLLVAPGVVALPQLAPAVLEAPRVEGITDAEADRLIRTPGTSAQDLVRAAAAQMGYRVLPVPVLPPLDAGAPLAGALAALYAVSGTQYDAEELGRAAAAVDARVQVPVARLVLALAEAGRLQQAATAALTLEDQWALVRASHYGEKGPEWDRASRKVDLRLLAAGAVLLLETMDLVVPDLNKAAAEGAWPPLGFADPAGLIQLGTEGADEYRSRRWLYLDPGGDDLYTDLSNSGGADPIGDLLIYGWNPILSAASLDMGGNDTHKRTLAGSPDFIQGVGNAGIGILRDDRGWDDFSGGDCGSGAAGVGLFIDDEGDDDRTCLSYSHGYAMNGIGAFLDKAGDDKALAGIRSFGVATDGGRAIFKDENGRDAYNLSSGHGFGFTSIPTGPLKSNASFVDLGGGFDSYPPWLPYTKNDHEWSDGRGGSGQDA